MASSNKVKSLTIVQSLHAFPPDMGGIETHAYNLCLELAKCGHKVIVHTSKHKDCAQIDDELKRAGIIVKRHFSISIPGFSSVKIFPFLCIWLALENADIYHSHGFGSLVPFSTAFASLIKRKKFVWTIHGIPKLNGFKFIFTSIYSLFATFPLLVAKNLICVSDSAKNGLPKFAQQKSTVIPNGVSNVFFDQNQKFEKTSKKNDIFKILFVGRLDKSKGIFMLAQAFNSFRKKHDSSLSYNGPDEANNKQKLLQYAKENNFCIEFSHLPMMHMPNAYAQANVTVLPSDYEGFGLSIIESWASKTPAISTCVGIAPQFFKYVFNEDAHNFLFHDEKSLIKSLEFIHSLTANQVEDYCKKAKDSLKDYSWKNVTQLTLQVYSCSN